MLPPPPHNIILLELDFDVKFPLLCLFYNFLCELNNIFHVKGFIRFTFDVKLIDDRRKIKQENIESLNLTQKVTFFRL